MDDAISRQAAIDAVKGRFSMPVDNLIVEVIGALPSAEVEPVKRGKWIPHKEKSREYIGTVLISVEYDYWFCDTCGYRIKNGQPMYNFCPNCGAKMEGAERE